MLKKRKNADIIWGECHALEGTPVVISPVPLCMRSVTSRMTSCPLFINLCPTAFFQVLTYSGPEAKKKGTCVLPGGFALPFFFSESMLQVYSWDSAIAWCFCWGNILLNQRKLWKKSLRQVKNRTLCLFKLSPDQVGQSFWFAQEYFSFRAPLLAQR